MKISIDLDGTYLEYPDMFDEMAAVLQMSGHEVGILSNRNDDEESHVELGFEPDFEFYLSQDETEFTDYERAQGKLDKMVEEDIDIHYDDEAEFFSDDTEKIIIEIE